MRDAGAEECPDTPKTPPSVTPPAVTPDGPRNFSGVFYLSRRQYTLVRIFVKCLNVPCDDSTILFRRFHLLLPPTPSPPPIPPLFCVSSGSYRHDKNSTRASRRRLSRTGEYLLRKSFYRANIPIQSVRRIIISAYINTYSTGLPIPLRNYSQFAKYFYRMLFFNGTKSCRYTG